MILCRRYENCLNQKFILKSNHQGYHDRTYFFFSHVSCIGFHFVSQVIIGNIILFLDAVAYTNFTSNRFERVNIGQFVRSMRPLLIFGNCIGVMPLKNFTSKVSGSIKFTVKCWNFIYSILIQLAIFALASTSFYKQASYQVEFGKMCKLFNFKLY